MIPGRGRSLHRSEFVHKEFLRWPGVLCGKNGSSQKVVGSKAWVCECSVEMRVSQKESGECLAPYRGQKFGLILPRYVRLRGIGLE